MRLLSITAFLICFAVFTTHAQDPPKKTQITEKQKKELQALSRMFVADFQRTKDIEPLIPKYFVNDFFTYDPDPEDHDAV